MKNNKGFTLVELLVAMAVLAIVMVEVFTVMSNSSRLYLRGTQEVELQAEAQQVILQLEDMLVDCHGLSVNYVPAISSDAIITISGNNGTDYSISYNRLDGKEYGNMYLSISNAGTVVASNIPMGEAIGSVSIDMATNYETNDIVTLYITMKNDRYTYTTTQDIYLRNQPGSGSHKRGRQPSGSSGTEFDVRRYGSYNIKDLCCAEDIADFNATHTGTYTFQFEWDSACSTVADSDGFYVDKYFELDSSGTICNTAYANGEFNKEFGFEVEYMANCYAVQGTTKTLVTQVKISTQKVAVGLGALGRNGTSPYGYGVMFPWGSDSSKYMSAVGIQGIDFKQATSVDFEVDVVRTGYRSIWKDGSITDINLASATMNISTSQMTIGNMIDKDGNQFNSSVGNDSLWVDSCGIRSDSLGECVLIDHTRILNTDKYYLLVEKGYIVDLHLTAHFSDGGVDTDLPFSIFTVPNNSAITSSSSDAEINKLKEAQENAWAIIDAMM